MPTIAAGKAAMSQPHMLRSSQTALAFCVPVAGGHTLDLTLDATNPSDGSTTVELLGGGAADKPFQSADEVGRQYRIGSFFDVFVDLRLEGTPLTAEKGPIHADLGVPEPASLALLAGPLLALGVARRR